MTCFVSWWTMFKELSCIALDMSVSSTNSREAVAQHLFSWANIATWLLGAGKIRMHSIHIPSAVKSAVRVGDLADDWTGEHERWIPWT
jgi:hypothetical protein